MVVHNVYLPFSEEDVGCGDGVILSILSSDRSRESFESSNGVEHLLVLLTVGCVGELFVEALLPPSLLHGPNFVRKSMLTLQLEKFGCKT